MNKQEARIMKMEAYLDESSAAVKALADALRGYEAIEEQYYELADYYGSPEWRADYEADEAGLVPADLKRGVLSEDAVYDLITEHRDLIDRMQKAVRRSQGEND